MYMKHSKISPWPVPELTGAQWVEPLPQAGYRINKAKPFLHPAIVLILQDGFFTVERGACLVQNHAECFKSSIPECEECEVTAPMAAFAATCVCD